MTNLDFLIDRVKTWTRKFHRACKRDKSWSVRKQCDQLERYVDVFTIFAGRRDALNTIMTQKKRAESKVDLSIRLAHTLLGVGLGEARERVHQRQERRSGERLPLDDQDDLRQAGECPNASSSSLAKKIGPGDRDEDDWIFQAA